MRPGCVAAAFGGGWAGDLALASASGGPAARDRRCRWPAALDGRGGASAGRMLAAAGPQRDPRVRDERANPSELLHLDTEKLGRFIAVGKRILDDGVHRRAGAGWQHLDVAIDCELLKRTEKRTVAPSSSGPSPGTPTMALPSSGCGATTRRPTKPPARLARISDRPSRPVRPAFGTMAQRPQATLLGAMSLGDVAATSTPR